MKPENIFVYVACGDDEHINTLNFSLKYLKHFTKFQIVVVTDLLRNKILIEHDKVIDIETPKHFNHHQASIYLKTGLHKFLNLENNYCYLDTDVIAIDEGIDNIFSQFVSPVTFASDHCALMEFSPYAVNCNCNTEKIEKYNQLDALQLKHNPNMLITDPFLKDKTKELLSTFYLMKRQVLTYAFLIVKYFLSFRFFHLNKEFYFDKKKNIWFYKDGRAILYGVKGYYKKIEKESFFRWDKSKEIWLDDKKENAYIAYCNHLSEKIKNKFNIDITDKNWRHWNGGVFLFNHSSVAFLDAWHNMTMTIFDDPDWKTRDQGTLIATAWKYGLQKQKRLPEIYNFIADYYKQNITFEKGKGFSTDKYKTIIKPHFIHIYHEFGRKGWDVWDAIEELVPNKNK